MFSSKKEPNTPPAAQRLEQGASNPESTEDLRDLLRQLTEEIRGIEARLRRLENRAAAEDRQRRDLEKP